MINDKHIINGIDVSKYFIDVVDEGGSTINYKILPNIERLLVERIFEQNQQLKRLQEENKRLQMLSCVNCGEKYLSPDGAELYEKNVQLQEENEKLKADLKGETEQCQKWYQLETDKHFQMLKYEQALEKIRKEYTNSIFYQCDKTEEECPCHNCIILGQLDRVQNIVKIIDEVLNDRD